MKWQLTLATVLWFGAFSASARADFAYFSLDGANPADSLTVTPGTVFTLHVVVQGVEFCGYDIGISISGPGPATAISTYQGSLLSGQESPPWSLYSPIRQPSRNGALLWTDVTSSGDLISFDIACAGYGDTYISFAPDSYLVSPCAEEIPLDGGSITVHQVPAPASLALLVVGVIALVVRRVRAS